MKAIRIVGIILVIIGILGFVVPRITYTEEVTLLEVGPLQVQTEQQRAIPIPDIAAGMAVLAGLVLVMVGAKTR